MTQTNTWLRWVTLKTSRGRLFLAALAIIACALFIYRYLLFPANPDEIHPWSSDGWGHLMKAQFLMQQISQGHWYPGLFPGWYNGMQLFRYWGPLPYYGVAAVYQVTGNIFSAGNWFLFLLSLFSGLSFLLYRRWLGLLPAMIGGILFIALPDNIRVAFADGNLPHVVATSLLPLTFYFVLRLLDKGSNINLLWLALSVAVMILSHAMMAAIFLVGMGLFVLIYWIFSRTSPVAVGKAIAGMIAGVLLSGWWLLPSLIGGATEVDQVSSSEALARFPLTTSLNPLLRLGDKEIFYIGLSLVVGALLVIWLHRRLNAIVKSLVLVGLLTALVSSTIFAGLFNAIPLSYLFRPVRFLSFGGFALVLGMSAFGGWILRDWRAKVWARRVVFSLLVLVMALDFAPSLGLVMARIAPPDLVAVADKLKALPGWREATLDLGQFGSTPAYLMTAEGGREQIFGWAYQGSNTVPMTSSINFAAQEGYDAYAIDRMERLGTDDILLKKDIGVSGSFGSELADQGYQVVYSNSRLELYHRDGAPRAYVLSHSILGIGEGAYNIALLFPQIQMGKSPYVDDYSLDFLKSFDRIVLSRFNWRNKARAEALVAAYAAQGGHAIIDLTASPVDVLAKEPLFLGVYGEPVQESNQVTLTVDGQELPLLPFRADYLPWQSLSPQGLDVETVTFPYYGVQGVALGYKLVGGHKVDFIGLNLMFHAVLTGDPVATRIMEGELGTKAETVPQRQSVIFDDYQATQSGYQMNYQLAETTSLVVPVAYQDGTVVKIDGKAVPSVSIDSMVSFSAPQGSHVIDITFRSTPVYLAGKIATILGVLGIISIFFVPRQFFRKGEKYAEKH